MRELAALMTSITVLTYGLFAHALGRDERGPAAPAVTQQTGPHQTGA